MTDTKTTTPRAAVRAFAVLMERELRENDHKGGWENDPITSLAARVSEEADELIEVVEDGGAFCDAAEVGNEAADVANMAMMVADNAGALRGIAVEPTAAEERAAIVAWLRRRCEAHELTWGKVEALEDLVIIEAIERGEHERTP